MTKKETIACIQTFLRRMFPGDDDIIEIFGLRGAVSYRYLSQNKHLAAIAAWQLSTRNHASVYWLTSPVDPDTTYAALTDRSIIINPQRRATNKDIRCRTHIVLDLDPDRESGTAATEEQQGQAIAAARDITFSLVLSGWPAPVATVSSGNGCQLVYGCDLPPVCPQLKQLLAALAPRIAEEYGVILDCSVHKAAQLARLPWLENIKAARLATILPPIITRLDGQPDPPVTADLLLDTLARLGVKATVIPTREAGDEWTPALDADGVAKLIEGYPEALSLLGTSEEDGVTKFFLDECPFAGHQHHGDPRKTAIVVGPDQFYFRCWSDDCAHFGLRDLRELLIAATGRVPPPFWLAPVDDEDLWDEVDDIGDLGDEAVAKSTTNMMQAEYGTTVTGSDL